METVIIVYNTMWKDYSHNSGLIIDLELFIATTLAMGKTVKFEVENDGN